MVVLAIFTVGYAAMTRHITATGSFYGLISHGLGPGAGMVAGLLGTLYYVVFEASIVGIFASFARTTIINFHGPTISWIWIALVGIAIIGVMGYFDIKLSGKVLGFFLITETLILLILGFAVLFKGGGPNGLMVQSLNPISAITKAAPTGNGVTGSVGIGVLFAFACWFGYESVAVYGEESRDPKKTIPRGLFLVVFGIGAFYIFVSWMTIAGNGTVQAIALARSATPFNLLFNITQTFVGTWAKDVYEVLIITGSFACALSFHNAASRYIYALGRESPYQQIRNSLGSTHRKHASPHIASFVETVVTLAIVLAFFTLEHPSATAPDVAYYYLYTLLILMGAMIVLILMIATSLSVISYFHIRKKHPETANLFRTLLAPIVGALGMLVALYLLIKNLNFAAGAAADSPFFKAMPWIVLAVIVIGALYAVYLRISQPDTFKEMGRTVLEEAPERDLELPAD
jgi:amino acid transporter